MPCLSQEAFYCRRYGHPRSSGPQRVSHQVCQLFPSLFLSLLNYKSTINFFFFFFFCFIECKDSRNRGYLLFCSTHLFYDRLWFIIEFIFLNVFEWWNFCSPTVNCSIDGLDYKLLTVVGINFVESTFLHFIDFHMLGSKIMKRYWDIERYAR